MKIVFHAGAHFTEEDRLFKTLLRNKEDLAPRGVNVPGPGRYRPLLRDFLIALESSRPSPDARDVMLDAILDDAKADRIILSHPHLFGAPRGCLRDGALYHMAPNRMAELAGIFDGDDVELFIAMRNPAGFLPAIFAECPQEDMESLLRGVSPKRVRWSDTLSAIRDAAPDVTITTWCFEDMPMLWAELIREMAGLDHGQKIVGGFDLLREIMSEEGMQRFRAYLKQHPQMTERQKRRVMSAFLDKFALDEALVEELEAPGWTNDVIDELTHLYEEDMRAVARIPGVHLITP